MKSHYLKYLALGLIAALCATFLFPKEEEETIRPRSYAEIVASGELHVTTEYNATGLYVEGDTLAGYYYELIQAFCRDHHLKAIITPEMSHDKRMKGLASGEFDVIAYGIENTSSLKDSVALTIPLQLNRQVLIQREAKSIDDTTYIKSHIELAGKTLHVVKGSPALQRIHNLSNEIGDTIYIKEVEDYGPEQLLSLVAHGDIDYAVCSENIAKPIIANYSQLDIHTALSFTQFYSWGVNKQSTELLDTLNTWLKQYKDTKAFKHLQKKYGY